MEEGTIGRAWICTGREYADTVYDASISFDFFVRETGNYSHGFHAMPTRDSVNTMEYLESLGIRLYTDSEIYGENYLYRGKVPMAAYVDYEDPYVEG